MAAATPDVNKKISEGETISRSSSSSVVRPIDLRSQLNKKPKKKFEIKKWDAVATWSWDTDLDYCVYCRASLMNICIHCQRDAEKLTEDKLKDCTIAFGTCNHAFHFHCIDKRLHEKLPDGSGYQDHCPLCPNSRKWEYRKLYHL